METIFTERAHLMCPRMCFGIVLKADRSFDEKRILETMDRLSEAHPFLNALLEYDKAKNAYAYRITGQSKVEIILKPQEAADIYARDIMDTYRQLTGRDWDLFEEGMLKAAVWKTDGGTCFLLVFHHLLADGRGALGLAEELADCYCRGITPEYAPERLIASKADLPADSGLPFISRFLVERANKDFAKENRTISYEEYHAFADAFLQKDKVQYSLSRTGAEELNAIRRHCHDGQVTVNDYLVARMMIENRVQKVIIACDLRDSLSLYRKGALGNYSTAFSVSVKKASPDPYALAKAVHARVQSILAHPGDLYLVLQCYAALDPGLLDAACIACRGNFQSRAGRFIGSLFFGFEKQNGYSVTNLGRIESRSIEAAFFIPPASPAIRKTQGILTVNDVMTVCTCERQPMR